MRPENHAATLHRRFANRAVAGAAGALLPIGLGPSTRDRTAVLGRGGALPGVGHLAYVGLVHHRRVRLLAEDMLRQAHVALALAGRVEQRRLERILILLLLPARGGGCGLGFESSLGPRRGGRLGLGRCRRLGGGLLDHGFLGCHQTFLPVGLPAGPLAFCGLVDCRTRTRAPLAPGTPPLTRSRFRSASTRTTL